MFSWKLAFQNKQYLIRFVLSFLCLFFLLGVLAYLLDFIENRKGFYMYDPILDFIKPRDLSTAIFFTTYACAITGLIYAFRSPFLTLHLVQMYTLLTALRIISLFFIPLDPPPTIIPMKDIFLQSTFYNGRENLKDLFFSGHTSTLFLLFFFSENRWLKWIFFTCALIVACGVLIQHAHYSYDVIAAPVFAYFSYFMIRKSVKFYSKDITETNSTLY